MTANREPTVPIYTIGYGSRSLDEFIAVLQRYDIRYLADVRSAPYSRYKPEFSKDALEAALNAIGIRYVYMGDTLGGQPKDPECYSSGKVDYEKVKDKEFYRRGIERIRTAFAQQHRVALMCSEGKPEQCHRSKLIAPSLLAAGVAVAHIDETGEIKQQDEVIVALTGGQLGLFGEPTFTSRKRYQTEEDPLDDPSLTNPSDDSNDEPDDNP